MKCRSFSQALTARPQLGMCSMYPAPGIIERIGQDWDWCWIDGQHGQWGTDEALAAVRACDLVGLFSMVRVPGQDPGVIGRTLDMACHAVMVPMVDTVEQAQAVVRAARFPPLGKRSYGGRRPIDLYGRAFSHADQPQPLVVCQIESLEALENAEAIAAVDGVDALFFGPDDMAQSKGMPMDGQRPAGCFDAEMKRVADAATRAGKFAAGIFTTPEALRGALAMGYRMIVCCGDVPLLAAGSVQAAKACRAAVGQTPEIVADRPRGLY